MLTTRHSLALLGLSLGFTACDSTTPRDAAETDLPISAAVEAAAVGPYYVPTTLKPSRGRGLAINNKGQAVGAYHGEFGSRAFTWKDGAVRDIGTLGGNTAAGYALNEAGQVVGESRTAAEEDHAFIWDGVMRDLGTLGGNFTTATGLNGVGQVVGYGLLSGGALRAFVWQNGRMTKLASLEKIRSAATSIDNQGRIVGLFGPQSSQKAFRWVDGVARSLGTLGGPTSSALGIFGGKVVGSSLTASGATHAFLWRSGVMTDLGTLGGDFSVASGINSLVQVVGWSTNESSTRVRAFVWENGVMKDLGAGAARGINRNGWIVGERPNPRATRTLVDLPTVWKPSATPPVTPTGSILVGNQFFYSEHNSESNPAVDTVAVGTTVTWEFISASSQGHSVQSIGSPSFASSPLTFSRDVKHRVTFIRAGTYQYNCVRHPSTMTGRVVVK